MFCGTRSFSRVDDVDGRSPATWSKCPSKKKTTTTGGKKKTTTTGGKKKKNPYSASGLDKFYTLVADLEARKQKIATAEDSLQAIWFVYSDSQDWVPLVVKLHEPLRKSSNEKKKKKKSHEGRVPAQQKPEEVYVEEVSEQTSALAVAPVEKKRVVKQEKRGREASRYLFWSIGVVLALILLCLAMFGRTFAICCTIMWWYFMPVDATCGVGGGDGSGGRERRKMVKQRDYERRTMSLGGGIGFPTIKQHSNFRRGTSYLSALHG